MCFGSGAHSLLLHVLLFWLPTLGTSFESFVTAKCGIRPREEKLLVSQFLFCL